MRLSFLDEPELEFGDGETHVDVRFGLLAGGPVDRGTNTAPKQLRVGVIGTEETITALRSWFDHCRAGVPAKDSRLGNLFPTFPGFSENSPFGASLVFHERWCSAIRQREMDVSLPHGGPGGVVRNAVRLFLDHADDMREPGGPNVIVCAPPRDLLATVDGSRGERADATDEEIDEGGETSSVNSHDDPCFHDLLKAEGMRLGIPIQMVRPDTYATGRVKRATPKRGQSHKPLQDEATRAWNIHTALYYKAGGVPWRLLRDPVELTSCFIGISFFRSLDRSRLLTSIAQVFNERGEGVIVKGAPAKDDKEDRQPHLAREGAYQLLTNAIRVYRREHRTSPARVVVHKTSKITTDEASGFLEATDDERIDAVDLLSMRRSYCRLLREGTYPPLRGSFIELEPRRGLLYLRGSVNFFATYPGMYVPRPLEFLLERSDTTLTKAAAEILSLSKLNWNNTQFDGGEPITVRAARRVGDILKCVPEGGVVQPSFRFFM